ncbi:hypothetical protein HYE82_12825 [Streptomyces sp. BR123]|uniref:hypothetical protein n=1 Tax=Streptomyces sp. BR123 TaxID=2749828 RepID=UPI0015C45407|nr:hypothetical protein [Streptomyces sp. BR123]NXY95252.1 hypothetical protein [Streptomyces sp. BR123]
MAWTVHFDAADDIGADSQGEIRTALQGVASSTAPQPGHWPSTVTEVHVTRRLAGGRSGSEVLEIRVEDAAHGSSLQVAKLADAESTTLEWQRGKEADNSRRFPIYTTLLAVSEGVLKPPERPLLRRQALVYQHVLDRDPSGGELRSVEDVVTAGLAGDAEADAACRTLRGVMTALTKQLHHDPQVQPRDLAAYNRTLGADLYVTFDTFQPDTSPVDLTQGSLTAGQITESQCDSTRIALNSTAPPGPDRSLGDRDLVALRLDDVRLGEHHLIGWAGHTAVRVEAVNAARQRPLADILHGRTSLEICGQVRYTRAQEWSRRLRHFLPGCTEAEGHLSHADVRVRHPLHRLHRILDDRAVERTLTAVHGDLNPRNIMLCGENPYLIDLAVADPRKPALSDHAWLEVCTLRDLPADQPADRLDFAGLVQLQRLLAVMCALATQLDAPDTDRVLARLVAAARRDSPVGARCLAMLWEIRRAAVLLNRGVEGPAAYGHLMEHLTLSACRALKFPDEDQSEHKVAVSASVAGVAAEALDGFDDSFFDQWPTHQAEALRSALLDVERLPPGCVDILTGVHLALRDDDEHCTDRRRDDPVISAVLTGPLRGHLPEREQLNPYIPLAGRLLDPGEPLVQQGDGALTPAPPEAVELLLKLPRVVIVGDTGTGKSTVAAELQTRLLRRTGGPHGAGCWPLSTTAFRMGEYLRQKGNDSSVPDMLGQCCPEAAGLPVERIDRLARLGALQLVIDDLHTGDTADQDVVHGWVLKIAEAYPRMRLVVCQRAWDYDPDLLRWPAVALLKVRKHQARDYIEDMLRLEHPRTWRERMKPLEEQIFNDLSAVALRDLAGKPLFLSMLIEHYNEAEKIASNPGMLVHLYLRRLLKTPDPAENDRKVQLLRLLTQSMEEYGSTLRYQDALERLQALQPTDTERTLAALVGTGVLETDAHSDWLSFCNPLVHAFCAAGYLEAQAATNLESVLDSITRFRWRDAAHLLVANPDADPDMVRAVLETALEANTVYGAWLLQAAAGDFAPLHASLISGLRTTLESSTSGEPAWREASYTLARYGTPEAMAILVAVARQADAAPAAGQALSGLVMMHQWFVPGAEAALTAVLKELLDLPSGLSGPLTVLALRSIATADLKALTGHVWSRLEVSAPWPVVQQARQTLAQLRVEPDRQLDAVYAEACRARLTEVGSELQRSADNTTIHRLNTERMELLEALAKEGSLETLLAHRFSVGLADHPEWHRHLLEAAGRRHRDDPTDACAQLVLDADGIAETQWNEVLVAEDDDMAVIAAHFLLRRGEVISGSRLTSAAVHASPQRLLALAAFVHGLDPQDLSSVERIVEGHCLPSLTPEYLEPLSSLVAAVGKGGVELHPGIALSVERALREKHMRQAMYWPWAAAWRDAIPDHLDTGLFLGRELSDADLLTLMGTTDVLLDAPLFDPIPLTFDQRERLLGIEVGDPTSLDAHRLVLLAASAGLHELVEFVRDVAWNVTNCSGTITHAHPVHGRVEVSRAAHALSAYGYLSALAVTDGAFRNTRRAQKDLTQLAASTAGMHPSMERARLIALGFLGDWEEIFTALRPEDAIMHQAAVNLTARLLHGPDPSAALSVAADIAEWIKDRQRDEELPAETRAVLSHIRYTAEFTMRRYVR